jgi:predicted transporter
MGWKRMLALYRVLVGRYEGIIRACVEWFSFLTFVLGFSVFLAAIEVERHPSLTELAIAAMVIGVAVMQAAHLHWHTHNQHKRSNTPSADTLSRNDKPE